MGRAVLSGMDRQSVKGIGFHFDDLKFRLQDKAGRPMEQDDTSYL
jgi:hypothetical protein